MNRFAKSGTRFFLTFAWFVVATLFADSANLDDLFTSNYVVHDDDEVASADQQPQNIPPDSQQHPDKAPAHPVRVIVDQDSPSLAADTDAFTLVAGTLFSEQITVAYETVRTGDCLYIKYRTLLI